MKSVLLALVLIGLPAIALADVGDDRRVCLDRDVDNAERIPVCSRIIDGGTERGRALAELLIARGDAWRLLGDNEAAYREYDAAVGADPTWAETFGTRGAILVDLDRPQEAVPDLIQATILAPDEYWFFNRLGIAYYDLDRPDDAMAALDEALRLNPRSDSTLYYRGYVHILAERYQLAVDDFSGAIDLRPFDPDYYEARGNAYLEMGNGEEAIRYLRVALLLDPNLEVVRYRLGAMALDGAAENQGRLAWVPPLVGLAVTTIDVMNEAREETIEEVIGGLFGAFGGTATMPLPRSTEAVRRTVQAVEGDIIETLAEGLFGTDAGLPVTQQRRILFALRPTGAGGPPVAIDYDGGVEAFWKMAPGDTVTGNGAVVITCPPTATPMTAALGCMAGVADVTVGSVSWTAHFEGWEYVVVPAGRRLAARVTIDDSRELTLFGNANSMSATIAGPHRRGLDHRRRGVERAGNTAVASQQ